MARLFISYKRDEGAYAFALRQWLIQEQDWPQHEVFVDLDKLSAGISWANKVFHEAETCEAMLFLASEASLRPDSFCYKELQRARGVTIAVTLGGLRPDDERLRSALPHGADARQITAIDGQPTDAFSFISPVDGTHGAIALNRKQVESIGQTLRDLGIAPNSFIWKATTEGPYRGLEALQEGDEALFFGREREVRDCIRLLEQMRQSISDRALVIHAPSGAGKSSLMRAGIWRRLRRHAAFSPLAIVRARQGVLTHEEWGLAAGLAKPEVNLLKIPLGMLEDRIAQDLPGLLVELADADASQNGARRTMLLGIDQAEEMAALSTSAEADELRRLFDALARAGKTIDLRLVLATRDDSIDATLERLAAFGVLQEMVRSFRLHRMPPPRFKDIIEKPAKVAEQSGFPLKFDDALATALAYAAAQNQGEFSDALPILALALQRLVRKRRSPDGSIIADPESAGHLVSDAVAEAAKEALEIAGADEAALRRLFIPRLVLWDPRAGEGGAAKRRVATTAELFAGDRVNLKPLADALVNQRLLTRAGDNYEVSHEALLRVAPLGSLLLELRGKFLRADMMAMEARDWMEYGRRIEWVGRTGERLLDAQALLADADFGELLSASNLGVGEYVQACVEKDRQERELRERIDKYQLASIAGGPPFRPKLLEDASISKGSAPEARGARIYISFSRQDFAVSERISQTLDGAGFVVLSDYRNIPLGEEWSKFLNEMIETADTVVFLLSYDSATSPYCANELAYAESVGKRIIPVMVGEMAFSAIPPNVADRHILFLRDETEYKLGMSALVRALSTDIDWVREQTRINDRALNWDRGGRPRSLLFTGKTQLAAEEWRINRPHFGVPPTEVQRAFIQAGHRARLRRQRLGVSILVAFAASLSMISATVIVQRDNAIKQQARIEELMEVLRRVEADNPALLLPPGLGTQGPHSNPP